MPFEKCPECGETNFEENSLGYRTFDCGFESDGDRRACRCGSPDPNRVQPSIPEEIDRYRLAFLDAAHAIEVIAHDMRRSNAGEPHASRCEELAGQMREFAGHTPANAASSFASSNEHSGFGSALSRFFRKDRGR